MNRSEIKYEQVKLIHTSPCDNCPSAYYPPDEIMRDMKSWTRDQQKQELFVCYKRTNKLCKGFCDYFGFTEDELKNERKDK